MAKGNSVVYKELLDAITEFFGEVLDGVTERGKALRAQLFSLHPADLANILLELDESVACELFVTFDEDVQLSLFQEFSPVRKVTYFGSLDEKARRLLLLRLPFDELTDFFDELSDDDLAQNLKLLKREERDQVLAVLQQAPDSVARYMETNVLTLMPDFTVEKSIQFLQRIQPDETLHRQIYVVDRDESLRGYIDLADLVLMKPKTRLMSILHQPDVVVLMDEDREVVAQRMTRYKTMTAPIVDRKGVFLGIISSDSLIDILETESSENIYRMASLSPIEDSYFDASFWQLFTQRGAILVILLFAQSISSFIIGRYELLLAGFLTRFLTMLISTGGNASSQTSALAIQGLATGEFQGRTIWRFVRRELLMALVLAAILSLAAFFRVLMSGEGPFFLYFWQSLAVSASLFCIVLVSSIMGSLMPFILRKFHMDPAHSAGPLLATLMDIVGIFIFCQVSSFVLG